jgi:hypothetical protein
MWLSLKVVLLSCSASACEHSWSIQGWIHSKRRNRLGQDLVERLEKKSYIVNLSEFYSYRLIGKLTGFLQVQEFCQCNQTVDFSSTSTRFFLLFSNLGLEILSPSLNLYVLTSTLKDRQSRVSLTLTLHTRKLLVF